MADERSKFLFAFWRDASPALGVCWPSGYGPSLEWRSSRGRERAILLTREGCTPPMSTSWLDGVLVASVGRIFGEPRGPAEAVLRGYLQRGLPAIAELEGEFSAIVFDSRQLEILAVRDSFGLRPLFHAASNGLLVLGTSPRDIVALLGDSPRPKGSFVSSEFEGGERDWAETIWTGVCRVPASHAITFSRNGSMSVTQTWRPRIEVLSDFRPEDAAEAVRTALSRSIERHADGEKTGFLLSSGIDSTLVAACATRAESLRGARCASVTASFPGRSFDETPAVVRNAGRLGLEARFTDIGRRDFVADWRAISRITEEPPDQDTGPVLLACAEELASAGVETVLTGMAADLLFDDFGLSLADRIVGGQALETLTELLGRPEVPWSWTWRALGAGLRRALRHRSGPARDVARAAAGSVKSRRDLWFDPEQLRDLWPGVSPGAVSRLRNLSGAVCGGWHERAASLYAAFGLEMRNPFLDRELVSLVLSLEPGSVSVGLRRKGLLNAAASAWTDGLEIAYPGTVVYGAPLMASAWRRYLEFDLGLGPFDESDTILSEYPRIRGELADAVRIALGAETVVDFRRTRANEGSQWALIAMSIWKKEENQNGDRKEALFVPCDQAA